MLPLFHRTVLRYAWRHKVIALFNILSLALGVGVYLAVRLTNTSADQAFRAGIDVVAGKSHLEVRAPATGVPETVAFDLASHPLIEAATPVVEGYATLPDHPGRYLHILGVDLFSNIPFATYQFTPANEGGDFDIAKFLSSPGTISLPDDYAAELGVKPGDTITAQINGQTTSLTIGPLFDWSDSAVSGAAARSAVMDIGWAQELFGTPGTIKSVQVLLKDPTKLSTSVDTLATTLPSGVRIAPPSQRSEQVQKMLEGFQLNLLALSMVAVLVGVFLIYSTVSASVVRRRTEIGTLRSTGASRGQVAWLFLSEAGALGILGSLLGVPLGIALASVLVGQVAKTISVHYVLVSISSLAIPWTSVAIAVGYGILATFAGAWFPAREAAYTDPVRALRPGSLVDRTRLRLLPFALAGIGVLILAVLASLWALGSGPPWFSFVSCLALVIAFSLLIPATATGIAILARKLRRLGGVLLSIAAGNFGRSLHRSAVTIAALMAAVSMVVGVSVMIASFRDTVASWVGRSMIADLYMAPAANEILGLEARIPEEIRPFLLSQPGVASVDTYLQLRTSVNDTDYTLAVLGGSDRGNLQVLPGGDRAKFYTPGYALVSEALATAQDLSPGDTISLPSPAASGETPFTVAAVYIDYSDDIGRVYLTRDNFDRHWNEPGNNSLAVYLDDDTSTDRPAELAKTVESKFSQGGELSIFSNSAIRKRIFEIFDQTFAVTYVLRTVAIAVAAIGILLALTTLVSERTREIAIFRALGAAPGQIRKTYLTEAGLIGLCSGILGAICGLLLSMVLTWVVNKAFFGWTIQFRIPWTEVLLTPLWVTAVAVASGLIPALRAGRLPISASLRSE